jgi:hypothetical protein
MSDQSKKRRASSAKDVKRSKFYWLPLDNGVTFLMRRIDMVEIFFEGALPTPILSAVDDLQGMRKIWLSVGIVEALASMTPEQRMNIKELMRRIAVRATKEPRLTMSRKEASENADLIWVGGYSDIDGDPDAVNDLPGDISISDLMIIWRATMGEAGVKTLPFDEAESFRSSESRDVASTVLDGEDVRPEAVVVDPDGGDPALAGAVPEQGKRIVFRPI